jgi:FtsH-binding integral membrane protein
MHNYNFSENPSYSLPQVEVRPLMRAVYLWMMFGLLTTAGVAFLVTSSVEAVVTISRWYMPLIILELVIVFGLSWAINKISPTVAGFLFFLYAAINGLVFGVVFFAYIQNGQVMAISNAFLTTAGLFGTMSVIGYTTKVDLTKFSTFFMMALIGLFIAMIVNFFLGSGPLDFAISVFGVLLFTALTAYDTQRIKNMASELQYNADQATLGRLSIMGALQLYLDFINIFIFLLRLFGGGRRD